MTKYIPILLLAVVIGGCAMSPGMDMSGHDANRDVTLIPITAALINEQQTASHSSDRNRELPANFPQKDGQYRLGVGDILSITVWDHPELTIPAGEYRAAETAGHQIAKNGTIFYPYIGRVKVAGKTLIQVRWLLSRLLSKHITKPQVDVKVAAYLSQKAFVVGEVANPGPQPITNIPLTIVDAIKQAGGTTGNSDWRHVTLTRGDEKYTINLLDIYEKGDMHQNLRLQNGDVLNVPDLQGQKIFVLGEVSNSTSLFLRKGRMTLSEALSEVGGIKPETSNPARIYVIRSGATGKPEVYHLNAKSPDALILGDQFKLSARDVVYVETAGVVRWNRVIEKLLPTTNLLRNVVETDYTLGSDKVKLNY